MIDRYTRPEMAKLWSSQNKYDLWLEVELAILWARQRLGEIDAKVYRQLRRRAGFDLDRITTLDEGPGGFRHDMLAFIEAIKETLRAKGVPESSIAYFHHKVTSYDIEDSAFSIQLVRAADLVLPLVTKARNRLVERAREHKDTLILGLTHGQAAEVTTLALKLLNYADILDHDVARLRAAQADIRIGRAAGAVGTYSHLSPAVERLACQRLKLKPAKISTQIIHRDRHAHFFAMFALLGCNIGHIVNNFWLMSQFPRLEAREPFRPGQRGSSQMPHKKNPVLTERLRGMAALLRGYLHPIMEMIATFDERAIDQSCVERIAYVDGITLIHYMLYQLDGYLAGMEFFPKNMLANIDRTLGQLGSSHVKDWFLEHGITELPYGSESLPTYEWVQRCAFEAWGKQIHLKDQILIRMEEIGLCEQLGGASVWPFWRCFDYKHQLQNVQEVYERFGI